MERFLVKGEPVLPKECKDWTTKKYLQSTLNLPQKRIDKVVAEDGFVLGQVVCDIVGNAWIVGEVVSTVRKNVYFEYRILVEPETVSQFTGLTTHIEQDIFGGDIIQDEEGYRGVVEKADGSWVVEWAEGGQTLLCDAGGIVVGNKWDDAGLLEYGGMSNAGRAIELEILSRELVEGLKGFVVYMDDEKWDAIPDWLKPVWRVDVIEPYERIKEFLESEMMEK